MTSMLPTILDLQFAFATGTRRRRVEIGKLIVAGWTGRDAEAVEAHIRELEEIGVERPRAVPTFYEVSPALLTTADTIAVAGDETSGEAEAVLLMLDGDLWVGLGSDHTDRKLEALDVARAKQACAKPIAPTVWLHEDIADHWDRLLLSSATGERPYQSGGLDALLSPAELIARYGADGGDFCSGSVMFCGTLPLREGISYAPTLSVSLEDPVLGRTLSHRYAIRVMP